VIAGCAVLNQPELARERFQHAEAAGWFGFIDNGGIQRVGQDGIMRMGNGGNIHSACALRAWFQIKEKTDILRCESTDTSFQRQVINRTTKEGCSVCAAMHGVKRPPLFANNCVAERDILAVTE
jgi:hypothetical protein